MKQYGKHMGHGHKEDSVFTLRPLKIMERVIKWGSNGGAARHGNSHQQMF